MVGTGILPDVRRMPVVLLVFEIITAVALLGLGILGVVAIIRVGKSPGLFAQILGAVTILGAGAASAGGAIGVWCRKKSAAIILVVLHGLALLPSIVMVFVMTMVWWQGKGPRDLPGWIGTILILATLPWNLTGLILSVMAARRA